MSKIRTKINLVPERGDITNITLQDIVRYKFVLPYVKNKKVLDIACGTGYGSEIIYKEGGAVEVWGIDIDNDTIKNNKIKYSSLKQIKFLVGSCLNIPAEDNFFDVSISIETLEHINQPEIFLAELKRVTKPEGFIIISTPLNNTQERFSPSNPFHIREYNLEEIEEMIKKYFIHYDFFFQENLLKKNWLTRITDKVFGADSKIKSKLKSLLPMETIRRLRVILKADKDITVSSEIGKNILKASVIITVIKNEK